MYPTSVKENKDPVHALAKKKIKNTKTSEVKALLSP